MTLPSNNIIIVSTKNINDLTNIFTTKILTDIKSTKPKAFCALMDCQLQPRFQLCLAFVLRQVQLVKASMRTGQSSSGCIRFMDWKLLRAANTLQRLKPFQGYLRSSRNKLQQPCQVLFVKRFNHLPEPHHLLRSCAVPRIFRVDLQIVHRNVGQPRDQQLELVVVKNGQ
jgi:hypothetical protein